jgi:hypothetical protein
MRQQQLLALLLPDSRSVPRRDRLLISVFPIPEIISILVYLNREVNWEKNTNCAYYTIIF